MKKIFTLLFVTASILSPSQNANWGWGLPITASLNGSTLNCSVFDTKLSQTFNTSVSSVTSFQNVNGIVAYVTSGSTVGGLVYDINTSSWHQNTFSSNSGNTISNKDGVIAWVSSSGTVGGAVYDPRSANWNYTTFSSNSGNTILNNQGVIAWVSSSGTVGGAVYDPVGQGWSYTTFSSNSGNTITNSQGIIAWVSSSGTVGGAAFDPAANSWKYTTFSSNSGNTIINKDGVVAWKSSSGTVGGAAFDPNTANWVYTTFSSSAASFLVSDGTVFWVSNNYNYNNGYDVNAQTWKNNYLTDIYCKQFVSHPSGTNPHITFLWCLTVGANSYTYTCGDGHSINAARWAWKQYNTAGNYNPDLAVFNNSKNSTCNGSVQVLTGIEEEEAGKLVIYPNPSTGLFTVEGMENVAEITIYNMLGEKILHQLITESANQLIDLSGQPSGVYFLSIETEKGRVSKRLVIQR